MRLHCCRRIRHPISSSQIRSCAREELRKIQLMKYGIRSVCREKCPNSQLARTEELLRTKEKGTQGYQSRKGVRTLAECPHAQYCYGAHTTRLCLFAEALTLWRAFTSDDWSLMAYRTLSMLCAYCDRQGTVRNVVEAVWSWQPYRYSSSVVHCVTLCSRSVA